MGFTTLRDMGDVGYVSVALRDAIASGIIEGPRIFASGQALTCTGGHVDLMPLWLNRTDDVTNVADGVEGVLRAVRRQVKMGVDWVKLFATGGVMNPYDQQEITDSEMAVLVNEAHSKGKPVAAHAMHVRGTLAAVKAGVDTVEHGSHLTEELIDLMIKRGTYLVPTLYYAALERAKRGADLGFPEWYLERLQPLAEAMFESFRMAYQAGVKIGMVTDAGSGAIPHGTNAFELPLMVENGMSEMESIVVATKTAAELLGLGDRLGTIEKGKWADVVVVDGNPLDDIKVLQREEKIALVMKEGAIYANRMVG